MIIDQFVSAFGVISNRVHGRVLRSFHATNDAALGTVNTMIDADPLYVEPVTVLLAANGNVRLWSCAVYEAEQAIALARAALAKAQS